MMRSQRVYHPFPHVLSSVLFLGCFILLAGCGSGEEGYTGPVGSVSGTVTLDGSPIAANVSFINAKEGFTATSAAGSDGSFTLNRNGSSEIPVGTYQVAVTEPPGAEMTPEQEMEAAMKSEDGSFKTTKIIPAKYSSPASSGLSFEVKEGENTFEVKMTKD